MKLKEFFRKFIHLEELEALLICHGLAIDGSKDEMIDRLLAEPSLELDLIFSALIQEDLQEICKAMTIPYTSNKDELWEMITERLELLYNREREVPPTLFQKTSRIGYMPVDKREEPCPYQKGWAVYLMSKNQRIIFFDKWKPNIKIGKKWRPFQVPSERVPMIESFLDREYPSERIPYLLIMNLETANLFIDDRKKRLMLITPSSVSIQPVYYTLSHYKFKYTIKSNLSAAILLLIYPEVLDEILQSNVPTKEEEQIVSEVERLLPEFLEYRNYLSGVHDTIKNP